MPAKQPDSSTAIPKGEPAVEQKDAQSKQQSEPASCPEPVSAAESAPQSASDAVASQDPAMEQPAPAASVSRAEAKSESSHDENSKAGPATSSEGSSSNALQPEAQASVGSAAAAAAAVVPAGAPVPAAEPPKPKTWASMAKALTNEGSGATATFKPPPVKAPAARPPSAMPAAGDRSRQVLPPREGCLNPRIPSLRMQVGLCADRVHINSQPTGLGGSSGARFSCLCIAKPLGVLAAIAGAGQGQDGCRAGPVSWRQEWTSPGRAARPWPRRSGRPAR